MYAYVHDQEDIAVFFKPVIKYPKDKDLDLEFSEKQYLTRLPSPYPSNCSYGQYNGNLLPAPYTEDNCRYTCVLKRLISKCGTLPEYILQYAPRLRTLLPSHNNLTDDEIRVCLFDSYSKFIEGGCDCRVSCSEMTIKTKHTILPHADMCSGKIVYLKFKSITFTNISEIPEYPAEKFVTDIGGWLGLFSGMSALSVVEIILFVALSLAAFYRKIKQYFITRRLNINPSPA